MRFSDRADQWITTCWWHAVCQVFWWVSHWEEKSWSKLQGLSESPRRGETGARRCGGGEGKKGHPRVGQAMWMLEKEGGTWEVTLKKQFLVISNCSADWFWIHLLHQLWKVTLINQLLCPCQSGLEHISTESNFGSLDNWKRVFSGIFDSSLASLARDCTYTKNWTVAPLLCVLWRHSSLVSLLITETSSSSFPEGAQASLGCRRWWNYGLVETWILISGVKWEVEIFPNIPYTEQFQILWYLWM